MWKRDLSFEKKSNELTLTLRNNVFFLKFDQVFRILVLILIFVFVNRDYSRKNFEIREFLNFTDLLRQRNK